MLSDDAVWTEEVGLLVADVRPPEFPGATRINGRPAATFGTTTLRSMVSVRCSMITSDRGPPDPLEPLKPKI